METPYTIITIISATAAIFSAIGSRRSSRIALMANGPGIEVASGVYQREKDTVGWFTLANVGGSEARDVYIELYHRPNFDRKALHRNPEPPIALWNESSLRRSTAIQVILPMMQFRAVGLESSFEIEPFTHAWVSYKDRLGASHGYYLTVDHMSVPIDEAELKDDNTADKAAGDAADPLPVLRLTGMAFYPLNYKTVWRRHSYLRRAARAVGVWEYKVPQSRYTRMRMRKTKTWEPWSPRELREAFPESEITAQPSIGMFSEEKPGKVLWQGRTVPEYTRMYQKLRKVSCAVGDVEVVCYDERHAIVEKFRLPCSFDNALHYLKEYEDRHG